MEFEEHVKFLRQFYNNTSHPTNADAPKPNTFRNAMRIMHVRSLLQNFNVFQDLEPSVQAKLPPIAQYCCLRKGTVLFRQGDAPGCCYIILSGQLTARIQEKLDASTSKNDLFSPRSDISSTRPPSSRSSQEPEDAWEEQQSHADMQEQPAYSSCTEPDALGVQVATLRSGSLAGEMALLKNQPRNATVVCDEDSEFLVIQREHFDSILKTDMLRLQQEKLSYLMAHVPSIREVPQKRLEQVAYSFEKNSFNKGHVFLEEGQVSQDCIYIVQKGSVEFRRREAAPASAFGDAKKRGVRRLGTLIEGGLFGSLSGCTPELFTVVATSSPCEVLFVSKRNCRHLPPVVTLGVEQYLLKAARWRLERCDGLDGVPGALGMATSKRLSDGRRNSGSGVSDEVYDYGCAQALARRSSATIAASTFDVQSANLRRRGSTSELSDLSKSSSLPSLLSPPRRRASVSAIDNACPSPQPSQQRRRSVVASAPIVEVEMATGCKRRASMSLGNLRELRIPADARATPKGASCAGISLPLPRCLLAKA